MESTNNVQPSKINWNPANLSTEALVAIGVSVGIVCLIIIIVVPIVVVNNREIIISPPTSSPIATPPPTTPPPTPSPTMAPTMAPTSAPTVPPPFEYIYYKKYYRFVLEGMYLKRQSVDPVYYPILDVAGDDTKPYAFYFENIDMDSVEGTPVSYGDQVRVISAVDLNGPIIGLQNLYENNSLIDDNPTLAVIKNADDPSKTIYANFSDQFVLDNATTNSYLRSTPCDGKYACLLNPNPSIPTVTTLLFGEKPDPAEPFNRFSLENSNYEP